jgi:hypothetical protein
VSETLSDTEVVPFEDTDDPAHRSHYVRPADNGHRTHEDPTTAQDIIDLARLTGSEVVALCGYRWVPKANPKKYPVCPACVEIGAAILSGERP